MRTGFILPGGPATEQLEQAVLAEQVGWDGIFVWEAAYGVDAWTLLGAIAARTNRIQLGTLLTPLPWRRPWKVASQVATLDQLSNGRSILTVGLGSLSGDLPLTGEVTDLRDRADRLDEGIGLIRELLAGRSHHRGRHYQFESELDDQLQVAQPVQERIPIWVVSVWPRPKSMRRVLACDGVVPQYQLEGRDGVPADAEAMRAWLSEHGASPDLDIVAQGETPAGDPAGATALVNPWAEAGCTWWLETRWELPHHIPDRMLQVRQRVAAGPPAVSSAL
jgi:alkanesulfonate monooxygenase SsuD/methylene tetrahydromethanopterin reductase-like flavin-dependent oxidoreductase (luciferase family)